MRYIYKIFGIILFAILIIFGNDAKALMELNFSKMAAMVPQVIQSELYNIQEQYTTALKDGTILQMAGQGFPEGGAMFANMAKGGFSFKNMTGTAFSGVKNMAGNTLNNAVGDLKNKGKEMAGSALKDAKNYAGEKAKSVADKAASKFKKKSSGSSSSTIAETTHPSVITDAASGLKGAAIDKVNDLKEQATSAAINYAQEKGAELAKKGIDAAKKQGKKIINNLFGSKNNKKTLDIDEAVAKAKEECTMPNWNDSDLEVTAADVLNLKEQKESCYDEIKQTKKKYDELKKTMQETIIKRDQLISAAILEMSTAAEMTALNEFDREDLELAIRELEEEREKNMQLPEETEETLNFDEEISSMEEQCTCVAKLAEEAARIAGVAELEEEAGDEVLGENEDIADIYNEITEKFFLKEDETRNADNTSRINKNRQEEYYLSLHNLFTTAVQTDGTIRQIAEKAQMMSDANTDVAQSNSGAQNMQIGVSIQVAKSAARLTRMLLARMRMETTENLRRWNTHYYLEDYSQDMTAYDLDYYRGETCTDRDGAKSYCRTGNKKSGFGFGDIANMYKDAKGAVSGIANASGVVQGAFNNAKGMASSAVASVNNAVSNAQNAAGGMISGAVEQAQGAAMEAAGDAVQSAEKKVESKFKKKDKTDDAAEGGAQ